MSDDDVWLHGQTGVRGRRLDIGGRTHWREGLKELAGRHRAVVAALEQALAAAHGENLPLRRRLAAYED
jgi:hypothetical protein